MSTTEVIDQFFDFYEEIIEENGIREKPSQIFNCDETGWTGKERSQKRVIGPKTGHVFKTKTTGGAHVTAHVCVNAAGRFLPTLIIYQGNIPHKRIEDVPDSWLLAASESGFMNSDIFFQWFVKLFVPNCGKQRPVLLVMDNHNSHVSVRTIEAAIENDILLVGLPGHTTHILQPLDVKVFGPLKARFDAICSNLPYARQGVQVNKCHYPAVLWHAMDQTAPVSIQRAFEVTGLYPFNRRAIDRSQLIAPPLQAAPSRTQNCVAETCPTCGQFTKNPLVEMGIVSEKLAGILVPPPVQMGVEKRAAHRIISKGRCISSLDMLNELKEKERREVEKREKIARRKEEAAERRDAKARSVEEKKVKREKERQERAEKKKKEEEAKEERKRLRLQKRAKKVFMSAEMAAAKAAAYVCAVCGEHGTVTDEGDGIEWFGCDSCDNWYHDSCLSISELWYVRTSLAENNVWYCKACQPWIYEE